MIYVFASVVTVCGSALGGFWLWLGHQRRDATVSDLLTKFEARTAALEEFKRQTQNDKSLSVLRR